MLQSPQPCCGPSRTALQSMLDMVDMCTHTCMPDCCLGQPQAAKQREDKQEEPVLQELQSTQEPQEQEPNEEAVSLFFVLQGITVSSS